MKRFEHGGDIYTHPGVVDFSASLNPLGMPTAAREALLASVDACELYPDPYARELVRALADFEHVDAVWVVPCAGATDAIERLCQVVRPRQALVFAPCYGGYEQALARLGVKPRVALLREEDDFVLGKDAAAAIEQGVDLVFLANPNNPTGQCLNRSTLEACLAHAAEVGAVVALDECFVDLSGGTNSNDLLADYPNLVIIKAFTKSFCLAGLRLGYALCANHALVDGLRQAGQTWAVSVPAQVAGVACVGERGHLERSRALVRNEREQLVQALTSLGLRVVPSNANYLLFYGPKDLGRALLAHGVMVRKCDNFVGLGPGWYRVAVRMPEQNAQLVAALKEVL